jgi:hypothetical protein
MSSEDYWLLVMSSVTILMTCLNEKSEIQRKQQRWWHAELYKKINGTEP